LLAQPQNEMLLAHDLRRDSRLDSASEKDRLRVAVSERLKHLMPA
jgi:hypothetical protein